VPFQAYSVGVPIRVKQPLGGAARDSGFFAWDGSTQLILRIDGYRLPYL